MTNDQRVRAPVIAPLIDVLDWPTALDRIAAWSARRESRYICI